MDWKDFKKNVMRLAFTGHYFALMILIMSSLDELNKLTNNKTNIEYKDSINNAKGWSIAYLILIIIRWLILHLSSKNKYPDFYSSNINLPPQQMPPGVEVIQVQPNLRQTSLLRPIQTNTNENESKWERFQSFLPIGPNYFVKNPTEQQKSEFMKMKKEFSDDEKICQICYINDSNTIINVCGHGGMCSGCAKKVSSKNNKCMLCRAKIDKILVIKFLIVPGHVEVIEIIKTDGSSTVQGNVQL